MLIVVEGADGSGKDTIGKALAEALRAKLICFPQRHTPTGKLIDAYLHGKWTAAGPRVPVGCSALAFQALQVANRMEVMKELNGYASRADVHCVLVRYWQSGVVYGGYDGVDQEYLENLHSGMARAHHNILLDVSPEEALERRRLRDKAKGVDPEIYEGDKERVADLVRAYQQLWTKNLSKPGWHIVSACATPEEVLAEVLRCVLPSPVPLR